MPPFQEKIFSAQKNVNQHANISDDPVLVIYPKIKILRSSNCRPLCRPLLTCAAPNFQLFCPYLPKISPFLT